MTPHPRKIRQPYELSVHTHLMDAEVSIGVKVVIFGRHVLSVGLLAAFCLATGDLGGGEWEQMGSHLGAPHRFRSLQAGLYSSLEYIEPLPKPYHGNPTAPTCRLASPRNPPPPEHHPGGQPRYLSQAYHLSSLSAPVSSSAHSWGREGRGRQKRGRQGRTKDGGAVNVVKEVATVLGEAKWGPKPGRSLD